MAKTKFSKIKFLVLRALINGNKRRLSEINALINSISPIQHKVQYLSRDIKSLLENEYITKVVYGRGNTYFTITQKGISYYNELMKEFQIEYTYIKRIRDIISHDEEKDKLTL